MLPLPGLPFATAPTNAPVGAICLYAGPIAQIASAANPAWDGCKSSQWTASARLPLVDSGPDSAAALLEAWGWMACDGRELRRSAFPALAGVLGTLYGGDAAAGTFCLPDLRGVFVRGVDAGAGVDPDVGKRRYPNGDAGYGGVGSLQCDALQQHQHDSLDYPPKNFQAGPVPAATPPLPPPGQTTVPTSDIINARASTETRPRNVALYYIIRAR